MIPKFAGVTIRDQMNMAVRGGMARAPSVLEVHSGEYMGDCAVDYGLLKPPGVVGVQEYETLFHNSGTTSIRIRQHRKTIHPLFTENRVFVLFSKIWTFLAPDSNLDPDPPPYLSAQALDEGED